MSGCFGLSLPELALTPMTPGPRKAGINCKVLMQILTDGATEILEPLLLFQSALAVCIGRFVVTLVFIMAQFLIGGTREQDATAF